MSNAYYFGCSNADNGHYLFMPGMIEPEELCDSVMEALEKETFLVLPHPQVLTYMQRKTSDYDRWLNGMRRLQARYGQS